MRRLLPTLILYLVTGSTAPAAPVPVEPARPDQLFTITTHRYGTKISPTGERDRVVLESRSGIGGAVIKQRGRPGRGR